MENLSLPLLIKTVKFILPNSSEAFRHPMEVVVAFPLTSMSTSIPKTGNPKLPASVGHISETFQLLPRPSCCKNKYSYMKCVWVLAQAPILGEFKALKHKIKKLQPW